jgi:hypothetical protein
MELPGQLSNAMGKDIKMKSKIKGTNLNFGHWVTDRCSFINVQS